MGLVWSGPAWSGLVWSRFRMQAGLGRSIELVRVSL